MTNIFVLTSHVEVVLRSTSISAKKYVPDEKSFEDNIFRHTLKIKNRGTVSCAELLELSFDVWVYWSIPKIERVVVSQNSLQIFVERPAVNDQ